MQIKPMTVILGTAALLWLGSMVWLTGYRQGYDEGSTTAWNDARSALTPQHSSPEPEAVELTRR